MYRVSVYNIHFSKSKPDVPSSIYGNGLPFDFESLEDIYKVMEITKSDFWEVEKDNRMVERSPKYQKALDAQKRETEGYNVKAVERTQLINQEPTRYPVPFLFPKGVDMWIERGKAEFNPRNSSSIRYYLSVRYSATGTQHEKTDPGSIYLCDFITKDKKLQFKKFAKEMEWKIGKHVYEINTDNLLRTLNEVYNVVRKTLDRIERGE